MIQHESKKIGLGALALLASATAPESSQNSLLQRFEDVDLETIPLPEIKSHKMGLGIRGMKASDIKRLQTLSRRFGDHADPAVLELLSVGPEQEIFVPISPFTESCDELSATDNISTLADLYQLRSLLLCFESLRDLAQTPQLVDSQP